MIKNLHTFKDLELKDVSDRTLILMDLDNNIITHQQQILRWEQ
jgi:hypothetical protein